MNIEYWSSSHGKALLAIAQELLRGYQYDTLGAGAALRKRFPALQPNKAAEAFEIILLREKASMLGAWAQDGFFTRQALEQSSNPHIAAHHAARFQGCSHVLEICTGVGFDTAALAHYAKRVSTIEVNPHLAAMARHNLAAQNIHNVEVLIGYAEELLPSIGGAASFDGLWCDPSRRDAHGKRIENPLQYKPSLEWLLSLQVQGRTGIKISPAVNLSPAIGCWNIAEWKREWLGTTKECLEQTLWKGVELRDGTVSLPEIQASWSPPPISIRTTPRIWQKPIGELQGYFLYEPHGCLIRSGHLADFFAEHDITLLDEHIAYGICAHAPVGGSWCQVFQILEAFDFNLAYLRERILAHNWDSTIEIKKRGFPQSPDEIRGQLHLPKNKQTSTTAITERGTVLLTRRDSGKHIALLAHRRS